ncbi:MAG: branched-chain amino acid ABC transporter permease, partial [Solirubrobacteraceae bacterium]
MTLFLQTLVSAVAAGAVYGLLGLGISLTYKTTGIINFAHGQVAILGAYVAYALTQSHVPLGIAVVAGIVAAALVSGAMERTVLRPLYGRDAVGAILVTFGVAIVLQEVTQLIWGSVPQSLGSLASDSAWHIGGVSFTPANLTIFVAGLAVSGAIVVAVDRTRIGRAMRGCAQDREMVSLLGVPTVRLYFTAFVVAGGTAGLAGVLIAPSVGLAPGNGLKLVVPAFAAAVLGGLGSLPGAVVGGILIAVLHNIVAVYINSAYADAVQYMAVIIVLLVRVRG